MNLNQWMIGQFERLDQATVRSEPASRRIAIISTPRCGSTWFCEMLGRTGSFGVPEEWLLPRMVRAFMDFRGLGSVNLFEYLHYIEGRTTTPNGIFTVNFHIDQYLFWKSRGVDLFRLRFDKVIYLNRQDKVAQAYSYAKAQMTDQWRSYLAPARHVEPQEVSVAKVASALRSLCEWDALYEDHMRQKDDIQVSYEELSIDLGRLKRILDECGVDSEAPIDIETGVRPQSDDADLRRIREIKSYLGGCDLRESAH